MKIEKRNIGSICEEKEEKSREEKLCDARNKRVGAKLGGIRKNA